MKVPYPKPMLTAFVRHAGRPESERIALGWNAYWRWMSAACGAAVLAAVVTPVLLVLVPNIAAQTANVEASTLILKIPNEAALLPTYALQPDGSLQVRVVSWQLPAGYEVVGAWAQVTNDSGDHGPLTLAPPTHAGGVTTWVLPVSLLGTGRHSIDLTYEVSNGSLYRNIRVSMARSWSP